MYSLSRLFTNYKYATEQLLALLYLRNKAENNEKSPKARSIYHSFRGIIHHVCPFLPLLPVFVVRSKVLTAVPCIPLAIYYVKRHGKAFSISFFVIMLLIHIFCTICGNYNKNNQLVLKPHTLATKLVLVVSPDCFFTLLVGDRNPTDCGELLFSRSVKGSNVANGVT